MRVSVKKSRESGMTRHFFVPQGTQDLGVVQQRTTHASVLIIIFVVSAAHAVPQVGLLCESATPETGFVWFRNTEYWSVRMQAVQWCHVHSSTGDLSFK